MNKIYIIIFKFHGDSFWKCCIFHIRHADSLIVNTLRAEEIKVMYCVFSCYVEADWQLLWRHLSHFSFRRSAARCWNVFALSKWNCQNSLFKIGRRLFHLVAQLLSWSWKKLTCWQHVGWTVCYVRIECRKSLQVWFLLEKYVKKRWYKYQEGITNSI